MARKTKPNRSDIASSTHDRIEVRGRSLPEELLGNIDLGDMAFLQILGRMPTPQESKMFNAISVTLVEHGITPSALAARITYAGAPESLQAAVAAGLCGLGSVFVGSTEGTAKMLYEALPAGTQGVDLEKIARDTVAAFRARGQIVPGLGHPLHKPVDPRAPRLFQIARDNGFFGDYIRLEQLICAEAERVSGKMLPVNATGAIGLVGHILEESDKPMAVEIWQRVEEEATAHIRPGA
jgi:citrate synthase